jgi:hypothetical protein
VLAFGRQRDFTKVLCDLLPGDTRITIQNYANDSQAFLNIPPRVANLHRNAVRKAGSNSRLDACQFPLERRNLICQRPQHLTAGNCLCAVIDLFLYRSLASFKSRIGFLVD